MRPWFEEYPDVLVREREAFEPLRFELDAEELKRGRVVFSGQIQRPDGPLGLDVVYPDSFPYLRPEVYAPDLQLGRHQNPFRHNLCTLERATVEWSTDNTGAWLVSVQVPHLLDLIAAGGEALREGEVPQGEPISRFFTPHPGTVIFVPAEMLALPQDEKAGEFRLAFGHGETPGRVLRACLARVTAASSGKNPGAEIARLDVQLAKRFGRTDFRGTWVRVEAWPLNTQGRPEDLLAAAREAPDYVTPPWQRLEEGPQMRVTGLVGPEEIAQGELAEAWLFVAEFQDKDGTPPHILRGDPLTIDDMSKRIPTLQGLQDKTVSLVGAGSIGAPVAGELGRALVGELRILDFDDIESSQVVRWPVGIDAAGHQKVRVLEGTISSGYPFTEVTIFPGQIGSALLAREVGQGVSEHEAITQFLDGAHLLLDATGEWGVQHLLSVQAEAAGIPQVYAWAYSGGAGGLVARVIPGVTGCWSCLQRHLDDGTIERPLVPEGAEGVQPRTCAAPTFVGSSFDALPVVAQAARSASAVLLNDPASVDAKNAVAVCFQPAGEAGLLSAPSWKTFPLPAHVECSRCNDP